jgi:transcriptional regulator with XRE-family HTH domain
MALTHAAGLTQAQCAAIESAVEDNTLPLRRKPVRSVFSSLFAEILEKIATYGITQQQLAQRAVSYCGNEPALSTATISMWKNGKNKPTLASLRSLICTLEECHDQLYRPIVSPEEIQQLMSAAGFSADDLTATTHDIIARIDETTRLKPLLSELRNAADLSVPPSAVDRAEAQPDHTIGTHRLVSRVNKWESSYAPEIPKPEQLRGLLERYNRLLQANGQAQLSNAEITKVVAVAEREHPASLSASGRRVTLKHTPLATRRPITPDLDDSRSR